jgi:hypothetical protein
MSSKLTCAVPNNATGRYERIYSFRIYLSTPVNYALEKIDFCEFFVENQMRYA